MVNIIKILSLHINPFPSRPAKTIPFVILLYLMPDNFITGEGGKESKDSAYNCNGCKDI